MKQYLTKDSLIVLGILAGVIICAVVAVYAPQGRKLEALRADIVTRQRAMEADARKAAVVPEMLRRVEQMRRRYNDRWEKKLPQRQELGEFIREISNHRDAEGLSGQLIEPGTPSKGQLYHTLPIGLEFSGSFNSLASFLQSLDDMERLTRVEKLKIVADNKLSPARLGIQMQMNIYFTDAGRIGPNTP
jgi:Tfp pilus assembly protein PilO